jgi:hypothetical protein
MAKSRDTLTQARLKELLHYDPETGVFTWREFRRGKAVAGSVAGSLNPTGYIHIYVDNNPYKAHRLAWLYTNGAWPEKFIDHINGVRDDNRLCNLRAVTNQENVCNIKNARSDSTTGLLGVGARRNKFVATVRHKGQRFFLGYFDTAEEAYAAYLVKKREVSETFTL